MLARVRLSMIVAILASLLFAIPAFAGGWAVITLDELPANVVAGEPFTVGFTVLQHGKTPMTDLHPTITANLYKEQELVTDAEAEGKPGHYIATVTLPKEGEWQWSVQAFTMNQQMPALIVAAGSTASTSAPVAQVEKKTPSISGLMLIRLSSLGSGLLALLVAFRSKSRVAMALTVLCLVVGAVTFLTGSAVPAVEAQSKSSDEPTVPSSISQVEYGRQLFIAKGCITCHYNSKAASSSEYWTIEMGAPNLSKFSANAEVIAMRLKDPTSVKSDTQMPNLNLKEVEIEALIAFINSN